MGRWEPDARGRLFRAALELYTGRGYDETTVAEIAERAGVTERTFFRHFADKREVLFDGSDQLLRVATDAVADAPDSATPLDAAGAGMEAAGALLAEHRDRDSARQRAAVIAATPSLQERELLKFAALSAAVADALRTRGVPDPAASLAADAGATVFKTAFEAWIEGTSSGDFAQCVRESLTAFKAMVAQ